MPGPRRKKNLQFGRTYFAFVELKHCQYLISVITLLLKNSCLKSYEIELMIDASFLDSLVFILRVQMKILKEIIHLAGYDKYDHRLTKTNIGPIGRDIFTFKSSSYTKRTYHIYQTLVLMLLRSF